MLVLLVHVIIRPIMALLQTKIEAPAVEPQLAARNSVRLRRQKASPQQLDAEIGLVSIATDRSAMQSLDAFVYMCATSVRICAGGRSA